MTSDYAMGTPYGKHLIFLCRMISLMGFSIGLGWFLVFIILNEWDLAASLLILGASILPCWRLFARGHFSTGLMFSQLVCIIFIIIFCLLYDVPEALTQRTTHLYLLVIGLVGYMNYQYNRSTKQIILIGMSITAFIILSSFTVGFSFVAPLPRHFRSISSWLNPILSIAILCGGVTAMHADLSSINAKVKSIRDALYNDEFVIFFQPLVDSSGVIIGAEALLRWEHPYLGLILPADFIPEAQEAGLMPAIGDWVISSAFAELALWQRTPLNRHITISINITLDHLMQHDFVHRIMINAKKSNIPPSHIKLEITESVFASDINAIIEKMDLLVSVGFKFSLDDFGTGFSSLSYLRRLPLEQMKIDRSFVSAATESRKGAVLARIISQMGTELGIEVVAEGIETREQWLLMQSFGCVVFQGFLFSPPVSAKALHLLISKSNTQNEDKY